MGVDQHLGIDRIPTNCRNPLAAQFRRNVMVPLNNHHRDMVPPESLGNTLSHASMSYNDSVIPQFFLLLQGQPLDLWTETGT